MIHTGCGSPVEECGCCPCIPCPDHPHAVTLDDLSGPERARLRHAVMDQGPGIYQSPLGGGSYDGVGRYLTEGGRLLPDRPWRAVWRCVVALIEAEPALRAVLDGPAPTMADRERRNAERVAQSEACLVKALAAYRRSQYDTAIGHVDNAELAAPDHSPGRRSYDELRAVIRDAAASAG